MVDTIAAEDSPAPRLSEIETLAGDVRLTDRSYWAALDVHDDLEHPVGGPRTTITCTRSSGSSRRPW
jgi:hypothetical protein